VAESIERRWPDKSSAPGRNGRVYALATFTAIERGYNKHVSQVVYSLPQSLVAMALGYTDRHVRNLQTELEFSGLLDSSALAAKVDGQNLWSTTLWAVKVATTDTTPHLHPEEFQFAGHRDFSSDLRAGNTVLALKKKISGLKPSEKVNYLSILKNAIFVKRFQLLSPRYALSPEGMLGSLRDSVYSLTLLAETGPETAKTVEHLAKAFSGAFGDEHNFLWWAKQFWSVVGSWERVGTLQAQLNRVLADLEEFSGIRNKSAWLNKRLTT